MPVLHAVVPIVSAHLTRGVPHIWPVARLVSAVEAWIMNRSARRLLWSLAVGALKLADASACVFVDAIMTCCPVFARAACAIVNVLLAVFAAKSHWTFAGVVSDHVDAFRSILALFSGTLVNVALALLTGKTGKAAARKGVDVVDAGGTVLARVGSAIVNVALALLTGKTGKAAARKGVDVVGAG